MCPALFEKNEMKKKVENRTDSHMRQRHEWELWDYILQDLLQDLQRYRW